MKLVKATYLVALFVAASLTVRAQWERYTPPGGDGPVLMELFTSEGCGESPAGDKAVVQLKEEYGKNLTFLEFHVDYWNNLGWRDRYSRHLYTERQKHYADLFGARDVYVPQVVINGKMSMLASDKAKIRPFLNQEIAKESPVKLDVKAVSRRDHVFVSYNADNAYHQTLNIALVLRHARTEVLRGENEGRSLNHTNIVRDLKTIDIVEDHGFADVTLPPGTVAEEYTIIAYTQKKRSWQVTSIAKCNIIPEEH